MTTPHHAPLPSTTELLHMLQLCGWNCTPGVGTQGELFFHTFQGGQSAPYARCRAQGVELLLIVLEEIQQPDPATLFARYLNFSLETRMVLAAAALLGSAEWLLLRTARALELYHLPSERCDYRVTQTHELDDELLPALTGLAKGRREIPTTAASPGAEPLRDWLRQWSMQLGAALEIPREEAGRLLWRWILMLQAARRVDNTEATQGHWGLTARHKQERLELAYDAVQTVEDLCHLLETFTLQFSTAIFPEPLAETVERLRALEDTTLLDRFRAELLMLAQSAFAPETVAWLFTDLTREQEGWRRELAGVEPVRKRLQHEGWFIYQPLVCDVGRHGLCAALRESERLAQHLNVLEHFQRQWSRPDPGAPLGQPDLFQSTPRGVSAVGELADPINYFFGNALRLTGVAPADRLGVGVTFLLHALALAQRLNWPFLGIDTLDEALSLL